MKTKPAKRPAYVGNTKRRVRCKSGIMGERSRLQSRYAHYDEFARYAEVYGFQPRLGYRFAADIWQKNPVIESSVNPSDLRVVFP